METLDTQLDYPGSPSSAFEYRYRQDADEQVAVRKKRLNLNVLPLNFIVNLKMCSFFEKAMYPNCNLLSQTS